MKATGLTSEILSLMDLRRSETKTASNLSQCFQHTRRLKQIEMLGAITLIGDLRQNMTRMIEFYNGEVSRLERSRKVQEPKLI